MAMANVLTPKFRVSYPSVLKPKLNELNGKQEYSLVALYDKNADLSGLKKAAQAALIEKFGSDQKKWPKNLKTPFRDQGEKEKDGTMPSGMEKGAIFMTLRTTQKPGLVNQAREDIIDSSDFYAGCYARALVSCYAYSQKGNAGVAFGLQHVQKVSDGEPFGNRVKVEDAFEAIENDDSETGDSNTQSQGKDATSIFN